MFGEHLCSFIPSYKLNLLNGVMFGMTSHRPFYLNGYLKENVIDLAV